MTTFTAKYLAPLNPGNKYFFDRNEAAKVYPVRRIPVDDDEAFGMALNAHYKLYKEGLTFPPKHGGWLSDEELLAGL